MIFEPDVRAAGAKALVFIGAKRHGLKPCPSTKRLPRPSHETTAVPFHETIAAALPRNDCRSLPRNHCRGPSTKPLPCPSTKPFMRSGLSVVIHRVLVFDPVSRRPGNWPLLLPTRRERWMLDEMRCG